MSVRGIEGGEEVVVQKPQVAVGRLPAEVRPAPQVLVHFVEVAADVGDAPSRWVRRRRDRPRGRTMPGRIARELGGVTVAIGPSRGDAGVTPGPHPFPLVRTVPIQEESQGLVRGGGEGGFGGGGGGRHVEVTSIGRDG